MAFNVTNIKRMGFSPPSIREAKFKLRSCSMIIVLRQWLFRSHSGIYKEKPPVSHRRGFELGKKKKKEKKERTRAVQFLNFKNRHTFYTFVSLPPPSINRSVFQFSEIKASCFPYQSGDLPPGCN